MSRMISVRRAKDSDSAAIRALVSAVSAEFGLQAIASGQDLVAVASFYETAGGWFEILETGEQLVGTIGMYPLSGEAIELRKMYFHPEIRGQGLGKALLARAILQAQQAGFDSIELETATALRAARALYRKFGFEQTAQRNSCSTSCDQAWRLRLHGYQVPGHITENLVEQ